MRKRNLFSKALAWLLIVCMVNPAMMTPAFARDTDIFLVTTSGSTTAEPNILLLLDTSGSMAGEKIRRLNAGVRAFKDDILRNPMAGGLNQLF